VWLGFEEGEKWRVRKGLREKVKRERGSEGFEEGEK